MFTFCRLFSYVKTICQIRHSVIMVYRGFFGILGKKQQPLFTEGLWEQTEALTCKQLMTADQHWLRFKHLMRTVITYSKISLSHSSAQFDVSASCSDKQMTSPMTEQFVLILKFSCVWLETWMKRVVSGLWASAEPAAGQWMLPENNQDSSAVRASCRLQLLWFIHHFMSLSDDIWCDGWIKAGCNRSLLLLDIKSINWQWITSHCDDASLCFNQSLMFTCRASETQTEQMTFSVIVKFVLCFDSLCVWFILSVLSIHPLPLSAY